MAHVDRQHRSTFGRFFEWLNGGQRPKQPVAPITQSGMIFVARDRQRNVTTVTVTVQSALQFVRAEAARLNGTVEEIGGGIRVIFKGAEMVVPFPKEFLKYISHATTAQGTPFGTKSVAVVQTKTRLEAVLPSPTALLSDDGTVMPPVSIVETPIPSPFSNTQPSDQVQQPQVGMKGEPAPAPWSNSAEEPSQPSAIVVDDTRRPVRAPWSNQGTP